jgi:hypothetical protein
MGVNEHFEFILNTVSPSAVILRQVLGCFTLQILQLIFLFGPVFRFRQR